MMPAGMRYCVLLLLVNCACNLSSEKRRNGSNENPPSPGFDIANSDPAAVELADSIMEAMGGRVNWDNTRFISWSFDGERELVWDRRSGNVRIESLPDSTTYLFRIGSGDGRVRIGGKEVVEPDSLSTLLQRGKRLWMNDSFWLVMLSRLKGDGVTLKYLGEERTDTARYNVLQITVSGAGKAPPGEYLAFVDLEDNLIKMISELDGAERDTGDFLMRWDDYRNYGNILLPASGDGNNGPQNIQVHRRLPDEIFEEF